MFDDKLKTLTRLICLITCSIGIYKQDITNIIIFVAVMIGTFWVVPGIIALIFKKQIQYDGELMIKDRTDVGTNYILRIYDLVTLPAKEELKIKVTNRQFDENDSNDMEWIDED